MTLPYDTKAPKPDSEKAREIREKSKEKGLPLPSWMDYKQAFGFTYEGHGVAKDALDPDTRPTLKRKKAIATAGGRNYMEEVKEYKISPYLTSETPHPLPDTGKQKDMMKATQAWSREGPLLPKEGLASPKELRNSTRGKNAKRKLQEYFTDFQQYDQREYDHRILPVRVGKKNYKWALYLGVQKMDKGKSGFVRASRRVKVKGGRYLRVVDVEAVEQVTCPTCGAKPKQLCKNTKTGETLPLAKTHRSRIKKYLIEVKKMEKKEVDLSYKGDTGV